jgi:hypothetical protein
MDLSRRGFLVAASGIALGVMNLPALPGFAWGNPPTKHRLRTAIHSKKEHASATWLEIADGYCQPMAYLAKHDADRERIRYYMEAIGKPGFGLERLREAPHQEGEWLVRLVQCSEACYVSEMDDRIVFANNDEAEIFSYDPQQAVAMNYRDALLRSIRLVRHLGLGTDVAQYMEPVRRDVALAAPNDVGAIIVDYLPPVPGLPPLEPQSPDDEGVRVVIVEGNRFTYHTLGGPKRGTWPMPPKEDEGTKDSAEPSPES